jgi:hypothetical protein
VIPPARSVITAARGVIPEYHSPVAMWINRSSSFEEEAEADVRFWKQMTPDERVAVLEQMRQEWLEQHGRADEGLRRIVTRLRCDPK